MKRTRGRPALAWLLGAALSLSGCAGVDVVRLTVDTGRLVCAALGCPCGPGSARQGPAPVAVDLYPDGTVRPVYAR